MPKSDSAEILLASIAPYHCSEGPFYTRGNGRKPNRQGHKRRNRKGKTRRGHPIPEIPAYRFSGNARAQRRSNSRDGTISGRSSSALQSMRNSSARVLHDAQPTGALPQHAALRRVGLAHQDIPLICFRETHTHYYPTLLSFTSYHQPIKAELTSQYHGLPVHTRSILTVGLTSGASSTRNVSYARNSSDFSALSEHSKILEISP